MREDKGEKKEQIDSARRNQKKKKGELDRHPKRDISYLLYSSEEKKKARIMPIEKESKNNQKKKRWLPRRQK